MSRLAVKLAFVTGSPPLAAAAADAGGTPRRDGGGEDVAAQFPLASHSPYGGGGERRTGLQFTHPSVERLRPHRC